MKNVVVVESPAKSRTLKKFLGKDFEIVASWGHIRDLPSKELGVDIKNDYQPKYELAPRRQKTLRYLKEAFDRAEKIYLATDLDREGEAIAWHIVEATRLKKTKKPIERIVFSEITKQAVQAALTHPRQIDLNLVNAQQARRVLDRLVGYKLSPFLWKKVLRGLSAGRVQSVAVRLIVEREREISQFKPQEYWQIWGDFSTSKKEMLSARLVALGNQRMDKEAIRSKQETDQLIKDLKTGQYQISQVSRRVEEKYPFPPYTTSTLQQDATYKLGLGAKKVMKLAQDLYEAGKITYMRTDSTNLAWVAVNTIRKYIQAEIGSEFLPEKPRGYRTKTKGAQEAHEAIRPSYVTVLAKDLTKFSAEHKKLYDLIWRRAVACQMKPARLKGWQIEIETKTSRAQKALFQLQGQEVAFTGFTKIYPVNLNEKQSPQVKKGERVKLKKLSGKQLFTQPPRRYNQASLIKKLEELGIGRPSTYAPIIDTIQRRGYVVFQQRVFYPTSIGRLVTELLERHFAKIIDYHFTASMEENLDKIAQGKKKWQAVIDEFYQPFVKNLRQKEKTVSVQSLMSESADKKCPKCGKKLVVKVGRFGRFLACSGYPDCRYTENLATKIGLRCPDCQQGEVVERRSKKGRLFYGCDRFPKCKWMSWERPVAPAEAKASLTQSKK